MAFLDNSGDIILDAVLTDMGRKRLASGRFTVSKFALGDEEINYELWDTTDARGTSFYDLQIMQTPILEAFTSDQSLMKTRLLTFSRNDMLYMPILKLNNIAESQFGASPFGTTGADNRVANPQFLIAADEKTFTKDGTIANGLRQHGIINGVDPRTTHSTSYISIDQGIENPGGNAPFSIVSPFEPRELLETAFIVKVDNRLLTISTTETDNTGAVRYNSRVPQFIDDDYVSSYYFTRGQAGKAIKDGLSASFRTRDEAATNDPDEANRERVASNEVFTGPLGRSLCITPQVKPELVIAPGIFNELGSTRTTALSNFYGADDDLLEYLEIQTTITVQGMTTGYSIDIPVKIIKGTKFAA